MNPEIQLNQKQADAFRPSDADLDAALEKGREFAKICAQGETGLMPHLMIEHATGMGAESWEFGWIMAALDVPFNEDREKEQVLRRIAEGMFRDRQIPRTVIFIAEAWLSHEPTGEPRHDPHREEVVTVMVATLDGRARSGHWELRRDAAGRIDLLEFVGRQGKSRSPLLFKFFRAFAVASGFFRQIGETN